MARFSEPQRPRKPFQSLVCTTQPGFGAGGKANLENGQLAGIGRIGAPDKVIEGLTIPIGQR